MRLIVCLLLVARRCSPAAIGKRPKRLKRRSGCRVHQGCRSQPQGRSRRRPSSSRIPTAATSICRSSRAAPVLVNLWASWCAPCIKELPTLQELEAAQAEEGKLGVIAVSQDMAPQGSVEAFLAERDIGRFAAYPRCRDGADRRARHRGHADDDPL